MDSQNILFVSERAKDIATVLAMRINVAINTTFSIASHVYASVPGSKVVVKYISASYQNDPLRSALELALIIFMIWFIFMNKRRPDNTGYIEFTEKVKQTWFDCLTLYPKYASFQGCVQYLM